MACCTTHFPLSTFLLVDSLSKVKSSEPTTSCCYIPYKSGGSLDALFRTVLGPCRITCASCCILQNFCNNDFNHIRYENDGTQCLDVCAATVLISSLSETIKTARSCWAICYPETLFQKDAAQTPLKTLLASQTMSRTIDK